jgi:hypothetical protein
MDVISSLITIAFAALVHASFQLSVSVLTLLSGHAIGAKRTHAKILRMTTGFITGACIMTMLLLSSILLLLTCLFGNEIPQVAWSISCGVMVGSALAIWLFYYHREKGTVLWVPRGVAEYLTKRTTSTKSSAEAFGLGLSSIIGEILFIIVPLFISSLILVQLPPMWQLVGIVIYTIISLLSLITIWVLVNSGHSVSRIQRWRETNKHFLQFTAGAGLMVLGFFIYVSEILNNTNWGM